MVNENEPDAIRICDFTLIRDSQITTQYKFDAPVGEWIGRLDYRAWGKSTNLFVFFTDVSTQEKYRLSVFSRLSYQPYEGGPNFKYENCGNIYRIRTGKSRQGLPKFLQAARCVDGISN